MSVATQRVLATGKLAKSLPISLSMPLWGAAWVTTNVVVIGLGTQIRYSVTCSFLTGILNGIVLSMVVVAIASERLQGGATGLLGGISLSGFRSDGSMIWKSLQGVHAFIDHALRNFGLAENERLHQQVENELVYMIWTTVLVMMASLVAEWVMNTRMKPANLRG